MSARETIAMSKSILDAVMRSGDLTTEKKVKKFN